MCWNPPKFKVLGIWLNNDLENIEDLNFNDKYYETKKLFNIWAKRSSTPLGRIVILKSLILSKLIYLWIMLPNPPDKQLEKLQKECFNFVWDNKQDKIKRTIATKSIKDGGLNIPDLKTYINTLKLNSLRKIVNNNAPKWINILREINPELTNLGKYGAHKFDSNMNNLFWKDVFKAYTLLDNNVKTKTAEELLAEPIFMNDKFKIGNKTIHFEDWRRNNIFKVGDLVTNEGTFFNIQEFAIRYNFEPRHLDFLGCVSSVKNYAKRLKINIYTDASNEDHKTLSLLKKTKSAKDLKDYFTNKDITAAACNKWDQTPGLQINWNEVFKYSYYIEEVKLKWFQIKINHRIIVTNKILSKMGVSQSDNCNFCEVEKDSILHYLWECIQVQEFWSRLLQWIKSKCKHCDKVRLTTELILFGKDNKNKTDKALDTIILNAKYFIYKCRINKIKPTIENFQRELKNIIQCEKYSYYIQMKENKFENKWKLYMPLL